MKSESTLKGYKGHPLKQKNKLAPNLWKGNNENSPSQDSSTGPEKSATPATKRVVPAKINKPTALHDASKQVLTGGNPFSNSAFMHNVVEHELYMRETFSPCTPALTQVTRDVFTQLSIDKPDLTKRLIPEELDYYAEAMLWFRIIGLKARNQQPLTPEETIVVKSCLGTSLRPTFPPLPTTVIQWQGVAIPDNFAAAITAASHNLYEELPCLGIHLAALITAQNNDISPWSPPGVPAHTHANQNLIGYHPTKLYRPEAYASVIDVGISAGEVQNYPPNTGLNFRLMKRTSEFLSSLTTFKTTDVSFPTLTEYRGTAQLAQYIPDPQQPRVRNIQGLTTIRTINNEIPSQIGVSIVFAPRYYKESPNDNFDNWCCLSPDAPLAADVLNPLPAAWFEN
ncbi:uncharacterized protein LOC120353201 [Nilaparvata lugens]|uniref:uncharacterized protein LOC120353201 n=1 Tax=Nilaparvata lugens TaxID=108931 RepID=UPI00193E3832|nr:uncharacterized protein LOC120353201 [Nilaparvata lugens]